MDAKTRFQHRLKLRKALAWVMELLAEQGHLGIGPDKESANLAAQVMKKLALFAILGTETGLADLLEGPTDLTEVAKIKRARQKESHARKMRARKKNKSTPKPEANVTGTPATSEPD